VIDISERGAPTLTYLVVAIIAVVGVLILMRLRSKSGAMLSSARPTRDRRSGTERRERSFRLPFNRRREHRRMEDAAAEYVNGLTKNDSE